VVSRMTRGPQTSCSLFCGELSARTVARSNFCVQSTAVKPTDGKSIPRSLIPPLYIPYHRRDWTLVDWFIQSIISLSTIKTVRMMDTGAGAIGISSFVNFSSTSFRYEVGKSVPFGKS